MDETRKKLRFGIMCSGTDFQHFGAVVIRRLLSVDGVEPALLIVDDRTESGQKSLSEKMHTVADIASDRGVREALNKASWNIYKKYIASPEYTNRVDLSDELAATDRIYCGVREEEYSEYFYEEDIKRIREYDLDFILRRGFGIVRGEILDVPRYGIWSFHHDDETNYRGVPACFWEIYDGEPVTGAILQRLTDRLDGGIILRRGHWPTARTYPTNVDQVVYGSTKWPAQVATDIRNGYTEYINASPSKTDADIFKCPSPGQIARYHLKTYRSLLGDALAGQSFWNIGVIETSIEDFVDSPPDDIQWCASTATNRFIADPFPAVIDGKTYVFVEEYPYETGKGKISYVEYPDGFRWGSLQTAIEEPFHMSYPFMFRDGGTLYSIPETSNAGEVRLYRVNAPDEWTFERTLVSDVRASDPTLVEHDGQYWLFFTTDKDYNSRLADLHVWYAPEVKGPWVSHDNNPVKTDVRGARPGGTPYRIDEDLFRPVQDCSQGYGTALAVNKVTALSKSRFQESRISEISPGEYLADYQGIHTLSTDDEICVVDGRTRIRNLRWVEKRIRQMKGRLF